MKWRKILNYHQHCSPFKWWHPFFRRNEAARDKFPGLLSQLTPEQRLEAFSYEGPLASGNQNFPKVSFIDEQSAGEK